MDKSPSPGLASSGSKDRRPWLKGQIRLSTQHRLIRVLLRSDTIRSPTTGSASVDQNLISDSVSSALFGFNTIGFEWANRHGPYFQSDAIGFEWTGHFNQFRVV
ncbi:hypothetical protein GQ457_13G013690 [Hibiscus cannabinus]